MITEKLLMPYIIASQPALMHFAFFLMHVFEPNYQTNLVETIDMRGPYRANILMAITHCLCFVLHQII